MFKCPKGHEFKMRWSNFKDGRRCPACWYESKSSKGEIEVLKYIYSLTDTTIIPNDRT